MKVGTKPGGSMVEGDEGWEDEIEDEMEGGGGHLES